ncbi:hypothetical protein IIY66_00770 [Candidatus Saccharibacteria bacterium]|nr:hypothetical protein [Candidatus Saccharibacteria bacterium]
MSCCYKVNFSLTFRFTRGYVDLQDEYELFTTPEFSEFFYTDSELSNMPRKDAEKTIEQWKEKARGKGIELAVDNYVPILDDVLDRIDKWYKENTTYSPKEFYLLPDYAIVHGVRYELPQDPEEYIKLQTILITDVTLVR